MAGIGWRLERLIHGGIAGASAAYATGAAVMALPWVLTTVVLVSLPALVGPDLDDPASAGRVVHTAYAVALIVAGPIQIVVSRHAADRLYERRLRAITAPFARGLGAAFLVAAALAAAVLLAFGTEPRPALWGAALAALVGACWTALSVGSGLCSPGLVLGAVGAGMSLAFALSWFLVSGAGLGVPGYLFGLATGQALTLAVLVAGILRALPAASDARAALLPAFRDYAALAGAGLAFNASLWVDKILAWCLAGEAAASRHAAASTVAWFSTIPCLAWVYVEVETTFHRRFRRFFDALEGGATLANLRAGVRDLTDEVARLLAGAVFVQAGVTIFLVSAAGEVARRMGLPDEAVVPYRFLLVGAGAEAVGLLGLILLYYFDLRREAFGAALSLLLAVAALTTAALLLGWPPSAGTLLGCAIGAGLTWRRVFTGVRSVLEDTLLGQPYSMGRSARPRRARPAATRTSPATRETLRARP